MLPKTRTERPTDEGQEMKPCPKHPEFRDGKCYYCGETMNKLDEILIRFSKVNDVIRTKREIIEFFKWCVPHIKEDDSDTTEPLEYESAWNDCREQMLKNIEELK